MILYLAISRKVLYDKSTSESRRSGDGTITFYKHYIFIMNRLYLHPINTVTIFIGAPHFGFLILSHLHFVLLLDLLAYQTS